jgi:hypothetical protein
LENQESGDPLVIGKKGEGRPLFQMAREVRRFLDWYIAKDITARYIRNQKKHHARVNFREKWKAILKRHGLPIDE